MSDYECRYQEARKQTFQGRLDALGDAAHGLTKEVTLCLCGSGLYAG